MGNNRSSIMVGGNKPTHNVNEHENSLLKIIYDIFAGDSSPHNCLGLGQEQCKTDGYRKDDKIKLIPVKVPDKTKIQGE